MGYDNHPPMRGGPPGDHMPPYYGGPGGFPEDDRNNFRGGYQRGGNRGGRPMMRYEDPRIHHERNMGPPPMRARGRGGMRGGPNMPMRGRGGAEGPARIDYMPPHIERDSLRGRGRGRGQGRGQMERGGHGGRDF